MSHCHFWFCWSEQPFAVLLVSGESSSRSSSRSRSQHKAQVGLKEIRTVPTVVCWLARDLARHLVSLVCVYLLYNGFFGVSCVSFPPVLVQNSWKLWPDNQYHTGKVSDAVRKVSKVPVTFAVSWVDTIWMQKSLDVWCERGVVYAWLWARGRESGTGWACSCCA